MKVSAFGLGYMVGDVDVDIGSASRSSFRPFHSFNPPSSQVF
jgi:hypothetical protein